MGRIQSLPVPRFTSCSLCHHVKPEGKGTGWSTGDVSSRSENHIFYIRHPPPWVYNHTLCWWPLDASSASPDALDLGKGGGRAGSSRVHFPGCQVYWLPTRFSQWETLLGSKEGGKSQGISLCALICWAPSPVLHGFHSHRTRPLSSTYTSLSSPLLSSPLPSLLLSPLLFHPLPSPPFLFHTLWGC